MLTESRDLPALNIESPEYPVLLLPVCKYSLNSSAEANFFTEVSLDSAALLCLLPDGIAPEGILGIEGNFRLERLGLRNSKTAAERRKTKKMVKNIMKNFFIPPEGFPLSVLIFAGLCGYGPVGIGLLSIFL